jgi:hypothetical protein
MLDLEAGASDDEDPGDGEDRESDWGFVDDDEDEGDHVANMLSMRAAAVMAEDSASSQEEEASAEEEDGDDPFGLVARARRKALRALNVASATKPRQVFDAEEELDAGSADRIEVVDKVSHMNAARAKKAKPKERLKNRDKIGDPEWYSETTLWSCNHGRVNGDVHAGVVIEAWKDWLATRCTGLEGIGRLERGSDKNQLHLQGWFECRCGTSSSDERAMKEAWKEHMGAVPVKMHTSAVNMFKGKQKKHWMTGYVMKTLSEMEREPGTSQPISQGDCFTEEYLQHCVAEYHKDCPKNPNSKKTVLSKSNIMLYAMSFVQRNFIHLNPIPSFGRTLQMMVTSKMYMPAPNFLATGYPLDRFRCEKLWRIQWDPASCTKEDICDCVFSNNEAMAAPVMMGSWDKDAEHQAPFPIFGDVDLENSPYMSKTFDELRDLNLQLNPNAHNIGDVAADDFDLAAPANYGGADDVEVDPVIAGMENL